MARPRIFISSTYYDLKHIRSSIELFVDSIGYEPVLSEKGDIAYAFDQPLDESCYREASNSDIFVLVVGGRYGSESSGESKTSAKKFYDRYDSITKKEFDSAYASDVPTYILIESGVYAEYQTYLRNKDSKDINYAHADSVNVFKLIEEILSKPRNNPVFSFDRSSEIEGWLRDQWAGLFRDMLRKKSEQRQLSALSSQVNDLRALNETLKTYMEAVLSGASSVDSVKIIEDQDKRLEESRKSNALIDDGFANYLRHSHGMTEADIRRVIIDSKSFDDAADIIRKTSIKDSSAEALIDTLHNVAEARKDFNISRTSVGEAPLPLEMTVVGKHES
jgi:hypothetical protein